MRSAFGMEPGCGKGQSGALVGIWMQSTKRLERGGYVPFGPFLATAGAVQAFLGGADVFFYINWLL